MVKRFTAAAVIASALFFAAKTADCMPAAFKNFLQDHPTVKVYVELKNSSGDDKVDIDLLKKLLGEAFADRKSYNFMIANTPDEADLIVKGDVTEYIWLETDPVDQVWGFGSAAMDAAMSDNYARMQVQTALIETGHDRTLWSEKVQATMTQHVMPKDSSYELVYQRFVKSLMTEVFRKREE